MPSYAQLQAESWWGREIVTPELDWLGDELCRRTERPRAAFGVKGDNNHLRGAHRSQEWILKSRYCTSRTYTVQSGLTAVQQRHVAGVDFTPGSAAQMVAQCKRIYAALRAGQLEEVREFYGNVDGDKVVDGWDNVRNRTASSDSSHLWHWHLGLDRRRCADRSLMERILGIVLDDEVEDDDMFCQYGDRGARVKVLQYRLYNLGHSPGDIDSTYGDRTAAALAAAVRAYNGTSTDGRTYGPEQMIYLDVMWARKYGGGQPGPPGEPGEPGPEGPPGPPGDVTATVAGAVAEIGRRIVTTPAGG